MGIVCWRRVSDMKAKHFPTNLHILVFYRHKKEQRCIANACFCNDCWLTTTNVRTSDFKGERSLR